MSCLGRILTAIVLAVLLSPAPSAGATDAGDPRAEALRHKERGDRFVAQERFDLAAGEYLRALRLSRAFPDAERVKMAVAIAWGDRPREASDELRLVLSQDPGNSVARVHLARFLAWSGNLDESLAESERVLSQAPLNRDALLVKADALRWKERHAEALTQYEFLLNREEQFDARVGKTYALLALGRVGEARQSLERLTPRFPYQERELTRLRAAMERTARTDVTASVSDYHDTDRNDVSRYALNSAFWSGAWRTSLTYRRTEARDPVRRGSVDELDVRLSRGLSPRVNGGFGIGAARERVRDEEEKGFLTAEAKADVTVPRGSAGAWLSSRMLTDTAQIIANSIRLTTTGVSLVQKVRDRLSCAGSYAYRNYSDENNAHDVQASCGYPVLTAAPGLTVSYRFRFMDFDRQSGGGYFDPDGFVSHLLAAALSWERGRLSAYLEPQFGFQSFERYGQTRREFVSWGYASAGWAMTKTARIEASLEGGDYAAQATAAYRYYQAGAAFTLSY